MLEILNAEVLDDKKKILKKSKTKKKQVLLTDTHRRIDDYFMMLKYRKNGNYADIPHFCIDKLGKIYQILDVNYVSTTFNKNRLDSKQIKIALENLGWLNKNTITGIYMNWIGDPFRGQPFLKSWRNYYYWDTYTEEQMNALVKLTFELCVEHDINYKAVPSSGLLKNPENLSGILSKSNFSDIYTDINPSFNFNIFEQYVKQTEMGV